MRVMDRGDSEAWTQLLVHRWTRCLILGLAMSDLRCPWKRTRRLDLAIPRDCPHLPSEEPEEPDISAPKKPAPIPPPHLLLCPRQIRARLARPFSLRIRFSSVSTKRLGLRSLALNRQKTPKSSRCFVRPASGV